MTVPIVFAHRGASGHAPDNTIEAFELAIKMGTTAIETDVKATRDGRLVFFHDYGIGKFPRYRPVLSLNADGLQRRSARWSGTRVPTVGEGFNHFRRRGILHRMTWSIDVPAHLVMNRLRQLARSFGIERAITFCNEQRGTLARWARGGIPAGQLAWSIRDRQIARLTPSGVVKACARAGIGILNVKEGWLSRSLARAVRGAGLRLFIWDCHDEHRLQRALSFTPDAIYTNFPDIGVRALAARDGR